MLLYIGDSPLLWKGINMKADLEYLYTADYDLEIKVSATIETVSISFKEDTSEFNRPFHLSVNDAKELSEMLIKAAEHQESLNKGKL